MTVHVVTNSQFAADFEAWSARAPSRARSESRDDGTVDNDDRLEAIGDIGFVLERTALADDDLLVVAGDNLFDYDLGALVDFWRARGERTAVALLDVGDLELASRHGVVELAADDQIVAFVEETGEPGEHPGRDTATYLFGREHVGLIRTYLVEETPRILRAASSSGSTPGSQCTATASRATGSTSATTRSSCRPTTSCASGTACPRKPPTLSTNTLRRDAIGTKAAQTRDACAPCVRGMLGLLLPQRCVVCDRPRTLLCEDCARALARFAAALPIAVERRPCGRSALRRVLGRRLAFAHARAAVVYDDRARRLVGAWKGRGLRTLAVAAAELAAAGVVRPSADVVTFVPPDEDRASGVDTIRRSGSRARSPRARSVAPLLGRTRAVRPQRGLDLADRRRATSASAFSALRHVPARVVLVDDVYTSRSTASVAASALRRAGAGAWTSSHLRARSNRV